MKKILIALAVIMAVIIQAGAVTFKVQVPSGTQKCYVCGAFNNWSPENAPQMTAAGDNLFTLTLSDVASVSDGYKYICGPGWEYVEKGADGSEINNRTVPGDPDIVGSWASVPEYGIETFELSVNGFNRQIKVYLPEGYDDASDSYPVVYYNTVQQRYNNAGADGDAGDYFFGYNSWDAHNTMEALRREGGKAYIMVQICSFLAENTAEAHPEYIGTGYASNYLNGFINELMSAVEGRWRTKKGAENTIIVGADYGALFSLYAAITRPDVFGTCVAMSPMLTINENAFNDIAANANAGQTYYISAGMREPAWMIDGASAFAETLSASGAKVYFSTFKDAAHHDEDWGASFKYVLKGINAGKAPDSGEDKSDDSFKDKVYAFYSARSESALLDALKGIMSYTEEYYPQKSSSPVPAFVFTQELGTSYKETYYWNIADGPDRSYGWLKDTNGTIGFNSNRKNQPAWENAAVLADGTVCHVAAINNGFNVVTGDGRTINMAINENFVTAATVPFTGTDKTFTIHYGSVNSGSDQGALTAVISVSEKCTEARITYDFNLNKVTVEENVTDDGGSTPETPQKPDFKNRTYSLYGGTNQSSLEYVGNLEFSDDYRRKGSDESVEAFVVTNEIAADIKNTHYYWNIKEGDSSTGSWLLASPKDISFSDKKTEISWQNIAVFENEDVYDIAAHSKGFKVVTGAAGTYAGGVSLIAAGSYTSTATVAFPTADKTFKVHFGSVNTSSDQGAVTPTLSVSDRCLEALITYDFNLNKVSYVETKTGDVALSAAVTAMTALPAACAAGTPVKVGIVLSKSCNVSVACKYNSKDAVPVSLIKDNDLNYHIDFTADNEGIYTFSVSLVDGTAQIAAAGEINVRVLPSNNIIRNNKLIVNAYKDINWETIGRYKSNFHTHTSQSFDTQFATSYVVDRYKEAGYKILALTDHDASSYPWNMFSLYNPEAEDRNPEQMDMLAIPGNELSKDRRNSWNEQTGGEFNHHNDLFTGRKGQEFMSLRESYAYTEAIGGLQIINHPGQYWDLSKTYSAGQKNSPSWHAENFRRYSSLIGLEVYNQGNRRPNDRILWDQILTLTMPQTPVWGYSCDDTHTTEQYFRNYQYMLMPSLTVDDLKEAMKNGSTVFSYEYTGSGLAKAPHINNIAVDETNRLITIDTDDADKIEWIYSTHRTSASSPSTERSTVVGLGNKFDYTGFQGSYVRARLINAYGETATQPFGFEVESSLSVIDDLVENISCIKIENDTDVRLLTVSCSEGIERISVLNTAGVFVKYIECGGSEAMCFSYEGFSPGVYVVVAATENAAYTDKFIIK